MWLPNLLAYNNLRCIDMLFNQSFSFLKRNISSEPTFSLLIFKDRFWSVHIPFFSMVKFQFLAQFFVDQHPLFVIPFLLLYDIWFLSD